MKIKLAILEKDRGYLTRIVTTFGTKYSDKFEIYSFTDQDVAMDSLGKSKIDVLLAGDRFEIDPAKLPARCAFAYLVDSADIDMVNNQRAICKFQKADLIYKQVLSVYSEKASNLIGFKVDGNAGNLIVFCSPGGGVGTSTVAASCALHYATMGKKSLYLNLETFGSSDLFFSGEGQFDMSDIIFALKGKKTNLHIKLESCVKRDPRGVYFYSQPKIALDMMELNTEDVLRLLSELQLAGEYDYVILDMDFSLAKDMLTIYRQSQAIVMVGDGSAESNAKVQRAFAALTTMEQNAEVSLADRMSFIYNRVNSKTGKMVEVQGMKMLGGAPVYSGGTTEQIMAQLAMLDAFDKIL